MCDSRLGRLLEVVAGQAVILCAHEALEVAPRVAGDAFEEGAVRGAERTRPLRHGPAESVGDEWCGRPQQEHRYGRCQRGRPRGRHEREAEQGHERAGDHLHHEGERATALTPPLGARRSRLPLQQAALRGAQPDERQADRVRSLPGLIRQERQLQCGLRQGGAGVLRHQAQEDTPRLLRWRTQGGLESQRIQVEGERQQERGRPDPRIAGQRRPREQQQGDGRGRHQAPPQVVQDLPAGDERKAVATQPGTGRDDREQPPQDLPVAAHPAVLAPRVGENARGVVVHHLDVGDEGRAGVQPLEQIVRQERVLGHAPIEGGDEGIHVVEPLAGEDPL